MGWGWFRRVQEWWKIKLTHIEGHFMFLRVPPYQMCYWPSSWEGGCHVSVTLSPCLTTTFTVTNKQCYNTHSYFSQFSHLTHSLSSPFLICYFPTNPTLATVRVVQTSWDGVFRRMKTSAKQTHTIPTTRNVSNIQWWPSKMCQRPSVKFVEIFGKLKWWTPLNGRNLSTNIVTRESLVFVGMSLICELSTDFQAYQLVCLTRKIFFRSCDPVYDESCNTEYPQKCYYKKKCPTSCSTRDCSDEPYKQQYCKKVKYCSRKPHTTCTPVKRSECSMKKILSPKKVSFRCIHFTVLSFRWNEVSVCHLLITDQKMKTVVRFNLLPNHIHQLYNSQVFLTVFKTINNLLNILQRSINFRHCIQRLSFKVQLHNIFPVKFNTIKMMKTFSIQAALTSCLFQVRMT